MTLIKESTTVGQITKLSNGLKVGNFSSPHAFTFEDGSVIPAVNDIDSQRLKVDFIETIVENKSAIGFDEDICDITADLLRPSICLT